MVKPTFTFRTSRMLASAVSLAALAACSTPPLRTAQMDLPAHYASADAKPSDWSRGAPADEGPIGPWWTIFHDPVLDALEAKVAVSSETIQKAVSQLDQARALVDYQQAGFWPTLTANTGAQRFRTSQNVTGRSLAGKTVPDYTVGVSASWEADVFGRVRSAVNGAKANADASASDLEAVRLAVSTDLARDYVDLRSLDRRKKLLDDSVTAYAAALKLLQQQLHDGAIDASAVAQAQTQLESTRTQAADVDVARSQLEHAIATLIGEPASQFSIPARVDPLALPEIPAGVPSELLQRRADIGAAERRVAAANAQIGEARAAFFPSLTLAASAGLESSFYAPWLTAPSLFWSLGPQLAGTIFDGGRHQAALRSAAAQYNGAVADYRQTVLVAIQQVEDNLSALQALSSEAQSESRAVSASALSLKLTHNRFDAGAVSYLDVVTAQTLSLSSELQAESIAARRVDATIALCKALGGPWQPATPAPVASTSSPVAR